MSQADPHPEEGRRRARHIVRASTRRRITAVDRIGRVLATISPGQSENYRQVWAAALVAGVVAFVALVVRMFVPNVIGMGDNGDGFALLCSVGLGNDRPFTADPSLAIYPSWQPTTWAGVACPAPDASPFSLYYLVVGLARLASAPFGVGLDLRALGVILALVVAVLVAALVRFLPGSTPFRLVVAGAMLVVLMDSSFVDFFVSAGDTGTLLVTVLAAFVALLVLWGGYAERVTTLDVPPRGLLALSFAVVLAALVVSSGPLGLAFLPGFVAGLLWVPRLRDAERARSRPQGRVVRGDRSREAIRKLTRRVPAIVACVLLLGIAAGQFALSTGRDQREGIYSTLFLTMLPNSPTPADDLEWFGLNPEDSAAAGQPLGSTAAADVFADPAFADVSAGDVVLFHVTHLERIVSLTDRGMTALATPLQEGRGNFLDVRVDDEGALMHDRRFIPVQWGSQMLYSVPLLIPASQIAGILLALALAFARTSSVRNRSLGWASFFLFLGSALVFWACVLGSHPAMSEALLPSTLVLWLGGPVIAACAAMRFVSGASGSTGASGPSGYSGSKSGSREPSPKKALTAAATRAPAPPSP